MLRKATPPFERENQRDAETDESWSVSIGDLMKFIMYYGPTETFKEGVGTRQMDGMTTLRSVAFEGVRPVWAVNVFLSGN